MTGRFPRPLRPGDRIHLVSPASTPERDGVERCAGIFESWGLKVEIGRHAFDELEFLAGRDEDRLADLNEAVRDPGIRAIIATRGGRGAYRIAGQLDFEAARRNAPFVVGFSDITIIHLALWKHSRLVGIHGPLASWSAGHVGPDSVESLRRALMTTEPIAVASSAADPTSALTTCGSAHGTLIGGNLTMIATGAGWALPDLEGAILAIEGIAMPIGTLDRQLTMLASAGHLKGIAGVAVGQIIDCSRHGSWTAIDILRQHLAGLDVPILGGLPFGHGKDPLSLLIGAQATLDADAGQLEIARG